MSQNYEETLLFLKNNFEYYNSSFQSCYVPKYRLTGKKDRIRRNTYTRIIQNQSQLDKEFYNCLSTDHLYLLALGAFTDLKPLPLMLLSYPELSEAKIKGLTYILESKNILSLVIESFIFMNEEAFLEILKDLRNGKDCFDLITELQEADNFQNKFESELDDIFFGKILDHMDQISNVIPEKLEPVKESVNKVNKPVIDFKKEIARIRKKK